MRKYFINILAFISIIIFHCCSYTTNLSQLFQESQEYNPQCKELTYSQQKTLSDIYKIVFGPDTLTHTYIFDYTNSPKTDDILKAIKFFEKSDSHDWQKINNLISQYDKINSHPSLICRYLIPQNVKIYAIKKSEFDNLNTHLGEKKTWKLFHKRFPISNSLIEISNISFTQDSTWAMLYKKDQYDYDCGTSLIYILKRESGIWIEWKSYLYWFSNSCYEIADKTKLKKM